MFDDLPSENPNGEPLPGDNSLGDNSLGADSPGAHRPGVNLLGAFVHQARSQPHATAVTALRDGSVVSLTWQQLSGIVAVAAAHLDRLLGPAGQTQRRLVYPSHNGIADIVLALACPAANIVEFPIDHRLGDHTAAEIRDRSGGIWLGPEQQQQLVSAAHDESSQRNDATALTSSLAATADKINAIDPALVLWTSGTTGQPKGVMLSHANLVGNAAAKLAAVPQRRDDIRLTTLPMCHAYARTCDLGTWLLSGCGLAIASGFDGWQALGPIVRPTLANTVPSLSERLLASPCETMGIDRLRLLGCGGAAMRESDFVRWNRRGATVIQGYGLTESGPVICSATPANATPGLVGNLVQGWQSDVRDGRLYVRGPHTMIGYLDDPEATARRIDDDGWLDTGDVVEFEQAMQQFRILGRADDTIVLDNGHKVHPSEAERLVSLIPGVRHAMLVGNGRTTILWIDSMAGAEQSRIEERAEAMFGNHPPWKRPREIKFFDSPLSLENGELTQKGAIRREVVAQRFSARST
tara:strand:+ start:553848 stop:555419 length:1572 start_codon:yes stop_codon:yes gene_type:complete